MLLASTMIWLVSSALSGRKCSNQGGVLKRSEAALGAQTMAAGLAGGLTIALPKGRTLEGALALLKKIGFDCQALDEGRKLLLDFPERQVRFCFYVALMCRRTWNMELPIWGSLGKISCSSSRKISMNLSISSLASVVWSWPSPESANAHRQCPALVEPQSRYQIPSSDRGAF